MAREILTSATLQRNNVFSIHRISANSPPPPSCLLCSHSLRKAADFWTALFKRSLSATAPKPLSNFSNLGSGSDQKNKHAFRTVLQAYTLLRRLRGPTSIAWVVGYDKRLLRNKCSLLSLQVTFLHGLGGANARDAVYNIMKTLFTDELASTKSMKGIRRSNHPPKDAFMGTPLFKAVMCK